MAPGMGIIEEVAREIATELKRQEPQRGGTFFLDAENPREAVIDGTFDLEAVAMAVAVYLRENDRP